MYVIKFCIFLMTTYFDWTVYFAFNLCLLCIQHPLLVIDYGSCLTNIHCNWRECSLIYPYFEVPRYISVFLKDSKENFFPFPILAFIYFLFLHFVIGGYNSTNIRNLALDFHFPSTLLTLMEH